MTEFEIHSISWTRFLTLRKRLFKAIKEVTEDPRSTWKSYEGAFYIEYALPNYFEDEDAKPKWIIHLSCYVLGPTRGEDWEGDSFDEALDKMEEDLLMWFEDHEEWMATKDADKEMEI